MEEPVGGRLECAYCEWDEHSAPAFVDEVQMLRLDDHKAAIQAEVEKREEVEAERDQARRVHEGPLAAHEELIRQVEAAESKLFSAVEELEKQKDAAETLHDYAIKCDDDLTRAYQTGAIAASEQAIALLRDKGTEQGGADA
ncbi:MAG TPA: hypothetical protein VI039_13145 [Solirubrobacterales bacterium]